MVTTAQLRTLADLEQTPEDDGNRYELIAGEIVVSSAPHYWHQLVSGETYDTLKGWVVPRNLGVVMYAPVDVVLSPHDVVEPDLVFIVKDRLDLLRDGRCHGSPDIVIEIHSPTTKRRDQTEKLTLYARSEIPEYWMINIEDRTIEILFLDQGVYHIIAPNDDGTVTSRVLPGLVVDPNVIFAALPS